MNFIKPKSSRIRLKWCVTEKWSKKKKKKSWCMKVLTRSVEAWLLPLLAACLQDSVVASFGLFTSLFESKLMRPFFRSTLKRHSSNAPPSLKHEKKKCKSQIWNWKWNHQCKNIIIESKVAQINTDSVRW